ncbi:MAG TPA: PQQ-dependent sugar dehydrogenase [Thermoanaerobaculia bacterium]
MNGLKIHTAMRSLGSFALLLLFPVGASAQVIELQPVATGLDQPVSVTHAGDSRLFITLQRGRVLIDDAAGTREFLDIRSLVFCGSGGDCGERGLLSVAFHPRYAENGLFYVYYTDREGDIVIERYRRSTSDPDRADPSSRMLILEIPHRQFGNHNGGQLQFGPDGYLYIGTGDGGGGGDPLESGQSRLTLLGKILRIDVDGGSPYAIPSSNPFDDLDDARGEIWAWGLRNPWRFSFDRITGDLWIADVGQNAFEEVNVQPRTSAGGENYGWDVMEGAHCFEPSTNCNQTGLVLPVLEYGRSDGCSVTGGFRYRGSQNPRLRGRYIYGDYCSGRIWSAVPDGGGWSSRLLVDTSVLISSFGEDANGELYVTDHRSNGSVYRIVDTAPAVPRRRAVSH